MMSDHASRRCRLLLALVLALPAAAPARAEAVSLLPPTIGTADRYGAMPVSGLALSGFDPVSYLTEGGPKLGLGEHELLWGGLVWRFRSEANRAAFRRTPDSFVPRIGGFDAWAATAGRIVETSPELFAVVDGRLYLFRTADARRRFLAEDGATAQAEARWRDVRGQLVGG